MKKVLTLVLALLMVFSTLTACSSGTGDDDSGDLAEITFMAPSYYGGELTKDGADQIIAAYEEFTNTRVTWRFEASDTYGDTFGLTLMDRSNMPMVLSATGSITGTVINAAKDGAFWDLTSYIESGDYPHLAQIPSGVLDSLTVDGMVIALPKSREIGRYGFSYREDWAEAVGITEAPQTIDDVYNMLWAFTYEDPDGNGKQDTYGMEMTKYTGPWDIIQTWFGVGNGWVEKDGDLVPVHETEEYKEALDWMRKIYADGLVRSDWFTVESSEWGNGCKAGTAGVYIDTLDGARRIWDYFVTSNVASVVDSSTTASMNLVGPIEGKTLATSGYNGYFLITKDGAKTEEDLKNCLWFLDQMSTDEMVTLADYGIEGLTYDLDEDGGVVMKEGLELANYPHQGLNQACTYYGVNEDRLTVTQNERQVAQADAYAICREVAVFNPASTYLTNSEAYANYGTIISQTIDDARTQYICGTIDWDGFQAAVKTWEDQGGAAVKEEVNEQYHASVG